MKIIFLTLIAPLLIAWLPTTTQIVHEYTLQTSRLKHPLIAEVRVISGNVLGDKLDELLAVGNLQEIIWQLQEHGDPKRAAKLSDMLLNRLEKSEILGVRDLDDGHSKAQVIELEDGLQAVFKTAHSGKHPLQREVSAYRFDRLVGTNVFPLTTMRAIKGEGSGSMQLFIENSMSAREILLAKREKLGLSTYHVPWYSEFTRHLVPPESPAIKTFRLLISDGEGLYNPGNLLIPRIGRQLAIDGGLAFGQEGDDRIKDLRDHPDKYLLSQKIVSNLAEHSAEIEEKLSERDFNQNLSSMLNAYKEAVENNDQHSSPNDEFHVLLEYLANEDWNFVNIPDFNFDHDQIMYMAGDLLKIAKYQRNPLLIKWVQEQVGDKYASELAQIYGYVLLSGDYKFVASLMELGIKPPPPLEPVEKSLRDAIAREDARIGGDNFNWGNVIWGNILRDVDTRALSLDDYESEQLVEKYLFEMLSAGELDKADHVLRNYGLSYGTAIAILKQAKSFDLRTKKWVIKLFDHEELSDYRQTPHYERLQNSLQ